MSRSAPAASPGRAPRSAWSWRRPHARLARSIRSARWCTSAASSSSFTIADLLHQRHHLDRRRVAHHLPRRGPHLVHERDTRTSRRRRAGGAAVDRPAAARRPRAARPHVQGRGPRLAAAQLPHRRAQRHPRRPRARSASPPRSRCRGRTTPSPGFDLEPDRRRGRAALRLSAGAGDATTWSTRSASPRSAGATTVVRDGWFSATFDQRGVNGKLGGGAYDGYVNGGASLPFGPGPMAGWAVLHRPRPRAAVAPRPWTRPSR